MNEKLFVRGFLAIKKGGFYPLLFFFLLVLVFIKFINVGRRFVLCVPRGIGVFQEE